MTTAGVEDEAKPRVPVEDWRPPGGKRLADTAMRIVAHAAGALATVCGSRAGATFGILTYHRIAPLVPGIPAPPYNVTPTAFREQLSGLQKRGFRFAKLSEALDCHERGESIPPRSVVVTFDDCFEGVYTHAWPVLEELQIPATLFLSTSYLDSESPFPFDTWAAEFRGQISTDCYRPIRTEQCREMAIGGLVELGTHTHTHADFREHVTEFASEMQVANEVLRFRFGEDNPAFAFPFGNPHAGYVSPEMVEAVRHSGARCGLSTECSLVDVRRDPFGWGRINAFDWDTSFTLAGKLAGWYDWAPRLKHRLQNRSRRGTP